MSFEYRTSCCWDWIDGVERRGGDVRGLDSWDGVGVVVVVVAIAVVVVVVVVAATLDCDWVLTSGRSDPNTAALYNSGLIPR